MYGEDASVAPRATNNVRVASLRALQPPSCVFEELPGDVSVYSQVIDTRQAVANMLAGSDDRLLVVVGLPRVANDVGGLKLLAEALASVAPGLRADLVIVLAADAVVTQDPAGDGSYLINRGIRESREHMLQLNKLGVPTAIEFRDTFHPQFFADLLSWASLSAQSEPLQELCSGLSMPVGVRVPATDSSAVIKALETGSGTHHFLGVSTEGVCGVVKSTGNPDVIAVVVAGEGEGASAQQLSEAMASVHRQRPSAALMAEFGPDALKAASLDESVGALCKDICSGGSLGSRIIGCQLRVPTKNATAASLSAMLAKLASATQTRRRSVSPRRPGSAAAGQETDNLRILDVRPLLPPACLLEELPREKAGAELVLQSRSAIGQILSGQSDRLLVLAGPAVIDQPSAALEYAARLSSLAKEVSGELMIVMKSEIFTPTTPSTGPWPGLLFDPAKDGSYQINRGIRDSRSLLLQLNRLGVPTALEFHETITPQFFADLLSWASLSANSETLGDMASGLSMPAGLRAPAATDTGKEDAATARAAQTAAGEARHFLGVTAHGLAGIVESTGNADCGLMLGGGRGSAAQRAANVLAECASDETRPVIAECGGHGAVDVDMREMAQRIGAAVAAGSPAPRGVAIHSYLLSGSQQTAKASHVIHGLSVTEPCMDWMSTEQVVRALADAVKERRAKAGGGGGKKRGRS